MTRLVLGESERFPEIATAFYVRAIQKTSKTMQDWLQTRIASREIATGMLREMTVMEPQRAVMLGQVEDIADGEIVARAPAHSFSWKARGRDNETGCPSALLSLAINHTKLCSLPATGEANNILPTEIGRSPSVRTTSDGSPETSR